jgi:hypothetical protein
LIGRPPLTFALGLGGALAGAVGAVGACSTTADHADGNAGAKILAPDQPLPCPTERQRCAVDFAWSGAAEASVELRGSFTPDGWTPAGATPMTSFGSTFRRTLLLPPGSSAEYKYCVDRDAAGNCARWEVDGERPTGGASGNNQLAAVACEQPVCLPESGPPPTPPLRFIAVGDTGDQGGSSAAGAMADKCQREGCDFVLLLGDNIYPSGASSPTDPAFQSAFEGRFAPVHAPFQVVLGNHDYGGNGDGSDYARAQNEVDHSAHSPKWRMPDRYYRFSAGGADFFALDTNAQMYSRDAQQKTDLKSWLAQSTASWRIAFGHHPYLSNGPHGNAGSYDGNPGLPLWNGSTVKAFADEVWCGAVDLYLCGHDHSRQWMTDTCNGTRLAVSGAGVETSSLPGTDPTEFESLATGFLYVVIEGPRLTAEFVDAAGQVSFTRTIDKPR